jgi:hypothetical protein
VSAETPPRGPHAAAGDAGLRPLAPAPSGPAGSHALALALARHADVVAFARMLVRGPRAADRVPRLASVFSFVSHLTDVPPPAGGRPRDGVDLLLQLAGAEQGPALILTALLLALGERAALRQVGAFAFVRVEIDPVDLSRLPPHAGPVLAGGRWYLPLDPRHARTPLGLLPPPLRTALGPPRHLRPAAGH